MTNKEVSRRGRREKENVENTLVVFRLSSAFSAASVVKCIVEYYKHGVAIRTKYGSLNFIEIQDEGRHRSDSHYYQRTLEAMPTYSRRY